MKTFPHPINRTMASRFWFLALLSCVGLGNSAFAVEPSDTATPPRWGGFTFSILPKSFQLRPWLDFHVITEHTPEGKKLEKPTAESPVHYLVQPGQFTLLGDDAISGQKPPAIEQLTRAMETALANNHYLKASPSTPLPAIVVVFNYGAFERFSMDFFDFEDEQWLEDLHMSGSAVRFHDRSVDVLLRIVVGHDKERKEVLRRAALIGGDKFARDLAQVLNQEASYQIGRNAMLNAAGYRAMSTDAASPFNLFMNANEKTMMLIEDSFNDCYFVVASAYDYRAMRNGKRVLLWRTKMTVNSKGISMSESLPPLILSAGPYFGREMTESVELTRRINRVGKVTFGETRVIEEDVTLPGAPRPTPASPSSDTPAKP